MKTIQFYAMGSHMNATIFSKSPAALSKLREVPAWFEQWEQSLSRFRPDSELSLYNQNNGMLEAMSDVFRDVLNTARRMEVLSEGLVTPRVRLALENIGYQQSFEMVKENGVQPGENFKVRDDREGNLDFGGVAKGWAAHQAMTRLAKYAPALVNAGGDIAISGLMPNHEGWIVNIVNPFDPDQDLAELRVGKGGVATSGVDYRRWVQGGVNRHHIIDPRTGYPADTDLISVTVIAPTVMEAEMAAKVGLILGSELGFSWLSKHQNYAAFLVFQDQTIKLTESIKPFLRS